MLFYPYFLLFILADAQIGEETLILRRNIERYLLKFFKNRILIAKIWEFRENLLYSVHLLLGGHALPLQDEPQQLPNLPADYMGINFQFVVDHLLRIVDFVSEFHDDVRKGLRIHVSYNFKLVEFVSHHPVSS